MKYIRGYSWAFVLGIVLTIGGWNIFMWQLYISLISVGVLVEWKALNHRN